MTSQRERLESLLTEIPNHYCADCKVNKWPRWASWNLGVFVCIRCSGVHRSMGTHISRVKSVDLDVWTNEQVDMISKIGNLQANAAWEAKLPDGYVPNESKIESFIRTKYELGRWFSQPGVNETAVGPALSKSVDDESAVRTCLVSGKVDLNSDSSLVKSGISNHAGTSLRKNANESILALYSADVDWYYQIRSQFPIPVIIDADKGILEHVLRYI